MNNAFEVYRYIQKRMKACKIPKGAQSCDEPLRIYKVAQRALKLDWITKKRSEEMHFIKVGNVWVSELRQI